MQLAEKLDWKGLKFQRCVVTVCWFVFGCQFLYSVTY